MVDLTGREYAEKLDAADELAALRDEFVITDPDLIYLNGNSLGRLPRATAGRLRDAVEGEWAGELVRGWRRWLDLPTRVGDALGEHLLGAAPGQVAICDSTSLNLYKLAGAALEARPERRVIVTDDDNFPSDRYVLQGLAAQRGLELRLVASDPVTGPLPEVLAEALDADVALLSLSHVAYRSAALADMSGVTAMAHEVGALVLWDLCHSVGAVPISLDATGVDLAAGCTHKYLNAGPGAPAFLYVCSELQQKVRQPIWGWFGQQERSVSGPAYDPVPDIRRFLVSSPSVLGMYAVEEGVSLLARAGIERLRAKGMAMTDYLIALADVWLVPSGFDLASPPSAAQRGSHVALRHPDAYRICRAWFDQAGVVADFRPPDRLRIGPAPMATRFVDVWDALDRLRRLVEAGEYGADGIRSI
jgi:kynureninase